MPFYKNHIPWNKGKIGVYTEKTLKRMSDVKKGISPSRETLKNMSIAHQGQIAWSKGKHLTKKHKKNLSKSHKGKITWNKGKTKIYSVETLEKMRNNMKGKYLGENHWNWKGGITPLTKLIRNSFKYRQWRSDVFTRDDFICQECGQASGKLNAHHLKSFSSIIQKYEITTLEEALECAELWNINNGITYCKKCHKKTDNYLIHCSHKNTQEKEYG